MKVSFQSLYIASTLVLSVLAQQEEPTVIGDIVIEPPTQVSTHINGVSEIERIRGLVANARSELLAHKNVRPSTEYSFQDIAFTLADYLPSWMLRESMWKQDPVSRRRQIAKVVRSSPLISRPRAVLIRDKVAQWTRDAGNALSNEYINRTTLELDSLLDSVNDFITTATDVELMDPLFLSAGYITLDNAIKDFLANNKAMFNEYISRVNKEFNQAASLSGELRGPFESLRHDAITQTQQIRKELFESGVEGRLRHFGHHIRTELQNLLQQVRQAEHNNQPEASKALREYTAKYLHTEVENLNDIKVTLGTSKSIIHHVWENATNELLQSPVKINYWVDVAAEIKQAIVEMGRAFASNRKHHNGKKHDHACTCGWNK